MLEEVDTNHDAVLQFNEFVDMIDPMVRKKSAEEEQTIGKAMGLRHVVASEPHNIIMLPYT